MPALLHCILASEPSHVPPAPTEVLVGLNAALIEQAVITLPEVLAVLVPVAPL